MPAHAFVARCRAGLSALRQRFPLGRVTRWLGAGLAIGGLVVAAEAVVRARIPPPESRNPSAIFSRTIPWAGGSSAAGGALPIATLDGSPLEARLPVRLDRLPASVAEAVLAVEDQRFERHHGLDLRRIAGAAVANLRARAVVQGGSTITQQLAKNLFLSARRTPLRKLREAAMALVLELRYDKRAILESYLNEIYLGQDGDRPIHGVGAASRYYFGKAASNLTVAESALLAGMIRAPNRSAPSRHPAEARARRDLVLRLMVDQGRISPSAADRAARSRIATRATRAPQVDGRYFRDFVLGRLTTPPAGRGVAIETTLDAALQRAAGRAVRSVLARLPVSGAQAALLVIDPRNGEVLALVGGRDYGASQFNRVTDARRQPGSAFKPIVAAAALAPSSGKDATFTLASVVEDAPLRVQTAHGIWQPGNYDGSYRGAVTLREALEQSLNVPFARVGLSLGAPRIIATARAMGIESPLQSVPSLALGSSEVTLLELVRAYGTLAAGGRLADLRVVPLAGAGAAPSREALSPAVAFLVTSALEGAVSRGTGRALNQAGHWRGLAGKTGTSNDWRDAWFVAYTPSLVVGAWVGRDDGRSLGLTGAGAALPMVAALLESVAAGEAAGEFEMPDGVVEGYAANASCDREYFAEGTEPGDEGCRWNPGPDWDGLRDWGRRLQRHAWRYLEELIAERLERRGVPR